MHNSTLPNPPKKTTLKKITCACTISVNGEDRQKEIILFLFDASFSEIRRELNKESNNTVITYKVLKSELAKDGENTRK